MTFKDFKYVVVVDEHNRPMSFSKYNGQLCYCDDEDWEDEVNPIHIISKKTAKRYIALSKEYRQKMKFDIPNYKMMPVYMKGLK